MEKRKKNVRKVFAYLLVISVCFMVCTAFACTQNVNESGFFTYKTVRYGETAQVFILGLTKEGTEQEYLVIPREIDGMPVVCIDGYADAPKLKKLFIPETIVSVNNRLNSVMLQRNAFIQGNTTYKALYFHEVIGPYLVVGGEKAFYAENVTYETSSLFASFSPNKANFHYYLNGEDTKVYFLDDLEKGEKVEFIPPDPVKEGFLFTGWFTDTSCQTPFDFLSFKKETDETVRLYAGWAPAIV